jgi:hypothetical protein
MRIAFLVVCLVGLTVGLNGQTGVQAPAITFTTPDGQVLPSLACGDAAIHPGRITVGQQGSSTIWVGQNVRITIGSTVITAESAVIENWAVGGAQSIRAVQLKGNVELKGTVSVE